jgi:hypothetical protein
MYQPTDPLPVRPGTEPRYGAFRTLTNEGARYELLDEFANKITPSTGTTCANCDGWGYTKSAQWIGCSECHGTGVIDG